MTLVLGRGAINPSTALQYVAVTIRGRSQQDGSRKRKDGMQSTLQYRNLGHLLECKGL